MNVDVVDLTRQLVRIPSLNPMNRGLSGPDYLEGRVTSFLQTWASSRELDWERHTVLPDRENLLMRLPGRGPAAERLLLLEVHQDTVPTDGMTIDPFGAELRAGRIYGRGACDVKGGMAAFLATVAQLQSGAVNHPTIVLACTVNEENGFDGIRHLRDVWTSGAARLLPRAPDVAVVAEPTELDIVVAHKGTVRWRCHTQGRAAHSSNPSAGENAIYHMAKVVDRLARFADRGLPATTSHPLLGPPTLSIGTIQGGLSVNTVPDRCTIEIDRRLLPAESPLEAMAQIKEYLARECPDCRLAHDEPFLAAPGLSNEANGPLSAQLCKVIQAHGLPGKIKGVPFGTDAGTISAAKVPVVVFGPGSIEQAHTHDEWVAIDSLEAAVRILIDFCRTD